MLVTAVVSTFTTRILVTPTEAVIGIVIDAVIKYGPLIAAAETNTSSPASTKSPSRL